MVCVVRDHYNCPSPVTGLNRDSPKHRESGVGVEVRLKRHPVSVESHLPVLIHIFLLVLYDRLTGNKDGSRHIRIALKT